MAIKLKTSAHFFYCNCANIYNLSLRKKREHIFKFKLPNIYLTSFQFDTGAQIFMFMNIYFLSYSNKGLIYFLT